MSANQLRRRIEGDNSMTVNKTDDMKGVIHICSVCHQIIDEKKTLARLEAYAKEYTGVQFSHGLCLKCARLEMAKIEAYAVEKP